MVSDCDSTIAMMVLSRPSRQAERSLLSRIIVGESPAILTVEQSCLKDVSIVTDYEWQSQAQVREKVGLIL